MTTRYSLSLLVLGLMLGTAQCSGQSEDASPDRIQVDSRRLLKSGPDSGSMHHFNSDISNDGTILALHSVQFEDISVYDFKTGTLETLYTPLTDSGFVGPMSISDDASMIAFGECCNPGHFLRVGRTDGTGARVVLTGLESSDSLPYVVPLDWAGSDSVLVLLQLQAADAPTDTPAEFAVVMVSVKDGSTTVVMENPRFPYMTRLSPDRRRLLVGPSAVSVFDRATQSHTVVAENGWPLGWSKDGRHIYYVTVDGRVMSAPGTRHVTGLYRQAVDDDGSLGKAVALDMQLASVEPLTVVQNRIYSYVTASLPTLRMLSVDLDAGRALTAPSEITSGRATRWDITQGDWSTDGTKIAYLEGTGKNLRVITRSTLGNNRREYRLPEDLSAGDPWEVRWHPDGESLYMLAMPLRGESDLRGHLLRLHLNTGSVERLGRLRSGRFLGVSNDGSTLYVVSGPGIAAITPDRRSGPDGAPIAEGVACLSGSDTDQDLEIISAGDCRTVADLKRVPADDGECGASLMAFTPSPDGRTLAISSNRCVGIVPEAGGSVKWLLHRRVGAPAVNWTSDGTGIIYQRRATEPSDAIGEDKWEAERGDQLVVYDLESGAERVVLEMDHIRTPRLSRDGSMLMYRGGEFTIELWVTDPLE